MTSINLRNIHGWETYFHAQHGTKTTLLFLLTDGEASWLLLSSLVFYYQGSIVQPETPITVSSRWQVMSEKQKKRISKNTVTTCIHLHKSVSTGQLFRCSFNQTNSKRWSARMVDVIKHLPHKIILFEHHH